MKNEGTTTALFIAREAWGYPLPDWIEVVAEQCMKMPQARVASRIGYSPAVVSQILRNRYKGNVAAIEDAVRGAWMGATVNCPVVGSMRTDVCRDWQRKAKDFKPTNSNRARMYWACASCPRARKEETA
ncbi:MULTISPECIES: hypothetical protein [unclassified Marinovum]|uniref:hypothetical protein n=1 Tax=unclassified Marinovum TaxID=2647166 RepID=UPI003EDC53DC